MIYDDSGGKDLYLRRATTLYNAAAALVIGAMLFQVAEPIRKGTADGMSLAMVVLLLIGALLRIPFFVYKAKTNNEPISAYTSPLVFLGGLLVVYCALLGVKIYFDNKKKKTVDLTRN